MQTSRTVQQLADDIIELANRIVAMGQPARDRAYAAFVGGTPEQQQPIVARLGLTPAEVAALTDAARATARGVPSGLPGDAVRQPEPWDYDPARATVADLASRRDLLRTRLRVLEYLRSL